MFYNELICALFLRYTFIFNFFNFNGLQVQSIQSDHPINHGETKIKIRIRTNIFSIMDKQGFSENCTSGNHLDCKDCMCNCHIPGTMAHLAKNVAILEKKIPGLGESL